MFVVDNSVVMAWCFEDEKNKYADRVLDRLLESEAIVPTIWPLEVVNVLLVAERRERLTPASSKYFLSILERLPIRIDLEDGLVRMAELLELGRTQELSSYDAAYLALAVNRGVPLATLDEKLKAAAENIGVLLLQ